MLPLDLLADDARRACDDLPLERLAGKTIIVTGASGIVGTHFMYTLSCALHEKQIPLTAIAVVQSEVPTHLQPLQVDNRFQFLAGDLSNRQFVADFPVADVIIHAATYGQPGRFMAQPAVTLKLNTTTTFDLIEKLNPAGAFLFISSSEVYSGLTCAPFSEDQIGTSTTTHPRSCYIEAKRCGEAICHAYRNIGRDVKVARLSLAYGPGTRPNDQRVLQTFVDQALRNGIIRMRDRGQALRTYCYVADAVGMMWRILFSGTEMIYNVGGDSRVTIAELAKKIGKQLHVAIELPPGDQSGLRDAPEDVYLNTDKFTREFGPVDFLPLDEGLSRCIAWQKAQLGYSSVLKEAA